MQEWKQQAQRWLQGTPCEAPCWEGITIGQTTIGEAMPLLRENDLVNPESVRLVHTLCGHGPEEIPGSRRLVWDWGPAPGGMEGGIARYQHLEQELPVPSPCGIDVREIEPIEVTPAIANSKISGITLELLLPTSSGRGIETRSPFTLADVIDAYGEPSHIVAVKDPGYSWYTVNIIYERQGFVLMRKTRSKLALDGGLFFEKLVFSASPTMDGIEYYPERVLLPWQGMKDFDFYCRLEQSGLPCWLGYIPLPSLAFIVMVAATWFIVKKRRTARRED